MSLVYGYVCQVITYILVNVSAFLCGMLSKQGNLSEILGAPMTDCNSSPVRCVDRTSIT